MTTGNGRQAVEITPEGGLAYWIINKTGGASVKGQIIEAGASVDNSVDTISIDDPDPIGIIYDAGIADGDMVRIVFSGKAEVLFSNNPTRHHFARNPVAADSGTNGSAISEPVPTPPFSTDKHFLEIGHVLETKGAPGLALVNLHFN